MGTRSVVALPEPGHRPDRPRFMGRYVHWDGYPSGVGAALKSIISRDGPVKASKTLIRDYYGWSTVTGETPDDDREPGRFVPVPGYGMAYSHAEQPADAWATHADAEDWGAEWVYVITNSGKIETYEVVGRGEYVKH